MPWWKMQRRLRCIDLRLDLRRNMVENRFIFDLEGVRPVAVLISDGATEFCLLIPRMLASSARATSSVTTIGTAALESLALSCPSTCCCCCAAAS